MNYRELNNLMKTIQNTIGSQETKVQKKLVKIFEKMKPYYTVYQDLVEDHRLDNAQVDEKGTLILNDKGDYNFTKEGLKALGIKLKEVDAKTFDFTPIPVVNPQGLEKLTFLKGWLSGVEFEEEADEEL